MTSAESFFANIEMGNSLPVAVRVRDADGTPGIASARFPLEGNLHAQQMCFHPDWRVRGGAAVMAVREAMDQIEQTSALEVDRG